MAIPFLDLAGPVLLFGLGVLLVAGTIKGTFGVGLPLTGLPLIAWVTDAPTAIAVMSVPVVVTNVYQAVQSRTLLRAGLIRFWPLFAGLFIATIPAARFLSEVDPQTGLWMLGAIMLGVGVTQFLTIRFTIPERAERWAGPLVGLAAGVLNGLSSLNGPITLPYLLSLGLTKDEFVAAISMTFVVATVPLYGTLIYTGVLSAPALMVSVAALAPVVAGMAVGTRWRAGMSERAFAKFLGILLIVAGANLVRRGVGF